MIICLEEEVLPFIPAASEHMLKDCEAKDLQEFIPLISQMTAKFKVSRISTGREGCPCNVAVEVSNMLLLLVAMAAAGVSIPAADLHAACARHLRGVGPASRGQRPGGRAGEADAEEELLHLHPDRRGKWNERGDGQSG